MEGLSEGERVCQLLQVYLPIEGAQLIISKLGCLEGGYTERCRWARAKREFRRVLGFAESRYGREGIKCCFIHFFLDAIHHGSIITEKARRRYGHLRVRAYRTPPDVARLMLLLAVQEDFPKYMEVAEELVSDIERKGEEIVTLVGNGSLGRLATPRAD